MPILAHGVAVEALPEEDAGHVRVAGEAHAVHVVDLALRPVGGAPDRGDRGHRRRLVGRHPQPDPAVRLEAVDVIDDVEARRALRIVGAADVHQVGELVLRLQGGRDLGDGVAPDLEGQIAGEGAGGLDAVAELLLERGGQRVVSGVLPVGDDRVLLPQRLVGVLRRRGGLGHGSRFRGGWGSGGSRGRRRLTRGSGGGLLQSRGPGGGLGLRVGRRSGRGGGGGRLLDVTDGGLGAGGGHRGIGLGLGDVTGLLRLLRRGLLRLVAHARTSAGAAAGTALGLATVMRSILRCRWRSPQRRASGRGGQPGT